MHEVAVIGFVIVGLQVLLNIIIFPIYFIYLRKEPIIKARSQVLEFAQWSTSIIFQARCLITNYHHTEEHIPCLALIWTLWGVSETLLRNFLIFFFAGCILWSCYHNQMFSINTYFHCHIE